MFPSGNMSSTPKSAPRAPIVLTPTDRATATQSASMASTQNDAESGIAGIFRQSTHPVPLFFLFAFRIAALVVYILSSYLGDFVVSTVLVVVLLAMDFWNCRNVAGRTLVGLRFWNQVHHEFRRVQIMLRELSASTSRWMMMVKATGYLRAEILRGLPTLSTQKCFGLPYILSQLHGLSFLSLLSCGSASLLFQ
jgi:hypothetical protein